jgi:hypothetical protein
VNEAHQRFHDWLTGGADGDPPRDVAVHASVCAGCRQSMEALDLLGVVNTGLAAMPVQPTGREHSPLVMAGRLLGATAVLLIAGVLGVGVSQLIGVSRGGGPAAELIPTPEQSVLAETATPRSSQPEPSPSPPVETLTPLGTPVPTHAPPVATRIPRPTLAPTPLPTIVPTPVATDTPVPSETPLPTAIPTPTPVPPTPVPPTPTPTPVPPPPSSSP